MTDIVERLRVFDTSSADTLREAFGAMLEAADEIERLRAELAERVEPVAEEFALKPTCAPGNAPAGRLTSFSDLEGRTVRKVVESPCGLRGDVADAVIVCDDDTWMPLCAIPDGSEHAALEVVSPYSWRGGKAGIADILSPAELLEAELVSLEQYRWLLKQVAAKQAAANSERAAHLRAEAAKLEAAANAMAARNSPEVPR